MGGEGEHRFVTELIEELLSTPVGTQNLWEKPGLGLVGWEQRGQGAVPIPCPHPKGIQGMLQPLLQPALPLTTAPAWEMPLEKPGKEIPTPKIILAPLLRALS